MTADWRTRATSDNFYSSPALFKALAQHGFGAVGTARKDRRDIPKVIGAVLAKGNVGEYEEGRCVLSLKWKDKRDVLLLSTYHDDTMVGKSRWSRRAVGGIEQVNKLKVVEEYNQFMGGVDRSKCGEGRVVGKYTVPM